MSEYFGYIHESSYDDIDDVDEVYNECDLALAEFDSYVQEGVGVAILAGAGIAAALGGLIAFLINKFGGSSADSVSKKADDAIKFIEMNGLTEGGVLMLEMKDINAMADNTEKYIEVVDTIVSEAAGGKFKGMDENAMVQKIREEFEKRQVSNNSKPTYTPVKTEDKNQVLAELKTIKNRGEQMAAKHKGLKTKQNNLDKAEKNGLLPPGVGNKLKEAIGKAGKMVGGLANIFNKAVDSARGKGKKK